MRHPLAFCMEHKIMVLNVFSLVGHAFVCTGCQPRGPPVAFHSDDMSSPCPLILGLFYEIPHISLLSYPHDCLLIFPCDIVHYSFMDWLH